MTITTPDVRLDTTPTVSWVRRHLGWIAVGIAVAATAVLMAFIVIGDTDATTTVDETIFDRSITAIDHQADIGAASDTPTVTGLLDASITAVDHGAGR